MVMQKIQIKSNYNQLFVFLDQTPTTAKSGYFKLIEKIRIDAKNRVFQVWQNRFDDLHLYSIKLLETKLEYIHQNPLQAQWNLVKYPEDYPYSSALFYVKGQQRALQTVHYLNYF